MEYITTAYIEARLEEAARTERMLPNTERGWLVSKSTWPDYVQEWFKGLHRDDVLMDASAKTRVVMRPTASQISRMDEVLTWLSWVAESRHKDAVTLVQIMWAVASGYSIRQVAAISGTRPTTCHRWYKIGLAAMCRHVKHVKQAEEV